MPDQLKLILQEAREWLESQPLPADGSEQWYALNNFRSFLGAISDNSAPQALENACHALQRHIVDQFDWSAPYCKSISDFADQVSQFAKDEAWRLHRLARSS